MNGNQVGHVTLGNMEHKSAKSRRMYTYNEESFRVVGGGSGQDGDEMEG